MKTVAELVLKHYNAWSRTKEGDHSDAFYAGARAACKAMNHVRKRNCRRKKAKK